MSTVIEHTQNGDVVPRKRVTAEDLELAATWLEQYEGDPDDDQTNMIALAAVAEWLRNEAERRMQAAIDRRARGR